MLLPQAAPGFSSGAACTSIQTHSLLPGTKVQFRVRAVNAAGAADWSPPSSIIAMPAHVKHMPEPPDKPKATFRPPRSALLSFVRVNDVEQQMGVVDYEVQQMRVGDIDWSTLTLKKHTATVPARSGHRGCNAGHNR